MSKTKSPEQLRSYRWLGRNDLRSFGHRSRLRQFGYDRADWVGKPVIGIINTWSEINACHGHLRERAEDVKRGVYQAGGFPIELPAMSLAEPFVKPSTMLYRNFLAMECEELLRSHPIDGAVLMGGCDKTTPGLIMGAISMGIPAIYVPAGPMLRGNWRGNVLGSGSDAWKYWDEKRAGRIGDDEWNEIEGGISRSFGTCMVMGTAATMMAITEALGLALPGASSIPAPDSNHPRMCAAAGRRAVEMVWEDLTPDKILTRAAFDNAIRVHMALGGSTNAIIHVIAMARRIGLKLDMARFDEISRQVPVIANITPSGKYLMEDFFYAGGLRALMAQMRDLLDLSCVNVSGRTLGDAIAGSKVHLPDVIHSLDNPLYPEGATAVLTGNLAPRGCVMKPAAADKRLLHHRGKAIAFENYDHMAREVDRDTFFKARESGGTMISSAYKLCAKMIDDEFPPSEWNIYPFHFSDGDNWSVDDTVQCVELLKAHILPKVNLFCYGQVESPYGSGQFIKDLNEHFDVDDSLVVSEIKGKEAIMDSIRDFLGKGK